MKKLLKRIFSWRPVFQVPGPFRNMLCAILHRTLIRYSLLSGYFKKKEGGE
jgi:hypothetical protein